MEQNNTIEKFIGVTELLPNILAVELTNLGDLWKKFEILQPDNKWTVPYLKYVYRSIYHTRNFKKDFYCGDETPLPTGSYEILFTTKKVSEEDAKKVVGKEGVHPSWPFNPLYTNYGNDRVYIDDARESLQSLLRSKNLDPAKNYLLIRSVAQKEDK